MAQTAEGELVDRFEAFYRNYYREEIGELAQNYPSEQRSLSIDWSDLYQFDADIADDYISKPEQLREYAEEALRLYDLPVDVSLGQAHVRVRNLPDVTDIRGIRSPDVNTLIAVSGIVRKATDVRPKVEEAAFECRRCGTLSYIPQSGGFQEPHECNGCERQGPFSVNYDQSTFVDAQKIRVQERPEGLRGGETPQSIDIDLEDDITGDVAPGDYVTVTGVLRIDQQEDQSGKSRMFDVFMDGHSLVLEDEEFEEMDISEEDKRAIVELSQEGDVYDKVIESIAPSIYGYEEEKLAIAMQLFSGVTKNLPDDSRIRGDLHILLIGDPGTGKCVAGDTEVALADGSRKPIREIVESNLDDPTPVDDGVYDEVDFAVPSLGDDGSITHRRARKVWKRETPDRMYRIQTAGGRKIEVTPSHPLFVRSGDSLDPRRAEELREGDVIAVERSRKNVGTSSRGGGSGIAVTRPPIERQVGKEPIVSIESVVPDYEWVYDLEVEGTHSYLSNGVVSHNSQLLQYIQHIAPRSVYTSGKGSSAAGLTAAAVQSDFGEGQAWTLEAGALVLADKGVAAVDELDKMKCVTGDSLVHCGDCVAPIRDLAAEAGETGTIERLPNGRTIRNVDLDVRTMTDDGRIVTRPVTAIHEYDAPERLTEVTLESGESLTVTADHPFFVLEDTTRTERAAEDLQPGDWTYVPRRIPDEATDGGVLTGGINETGTNSPDVPPSKGAILGYLAGDGNVYYDREEGSYGVRFTNAEEQLLADFESACRRAFDAEPVRYPSEQRDDGVGTVRLHGKEYVDELLDAGANLETYDGKRLPRGVTEATRETKAAFLRALADSEGSVDERKVVVCSSSYELLLGAKSLLLEFGVSSQIQTRERDGKRDVYLLAITAKPSLDAFARHVGFTLDRKESALREARDRVTGTRTILDVVPECGEALERVRGTLRLHQSECGLDSDATYCNFENGDANPSIRLADRILTRFDDRLDRVKQDLDVLTSEASWEKLTSIRERYHVSQRELAADLPTTQAHLSCQWGGGAKLRDQVRRRLRDILAEAASVDLDPLRRLVRGDVKWRRVESVRDVSPDVLDDRIPVLRRRIADELNMSDPMDAESRARELVEAESDPDTWSDLRDELDRYEIPFRQVADTMGVDGSTVSRWFSGTIRIGNFTAVRSACRDLIARRRRRLDGLLGRIDARSGTKVYDLTVKGTHNFVANGMVVHNSEDRSAMHEGLEQQEISISKAGITATLKSRCSLLGAANPKYGRFDEYEPIAEQIELDPALISRFDLIFTVTDQPDEEEDRRLAEHIIQSNYAGELSTQHEKLASPNVSMEEATEAARNVEPTIDAELLRKYVAYAKRDVFPTMTEEARERIREFYVEMRSHGTGEDAPVPITARKLEALVRLGEASARVRLSDTVTEEDAERVIDIVQSSLRDVGMDPETGEFDADIIETEMSKSQRDRVKGIKEVIRELQDEYDEGAPREKVLERAEEVGIESDKAEHEIQKLRDSGEVYSPKGDTLRVV
jgi:replicative DNA helicase Mcm